MDNEREIIKQIEERKKERRETMNTWLSKHGYSELVTINEKMDLQLLKGRSVEILPSTKITEENFINAVAKIIPELQERDARLEEEEGRWRESVGNRLNEWLNDLGVKGVTARPPLLITRSMKTTEQTAIFMDEQVLWHLDSENEQFSKEEFLTKVKEVLKGGKPRT